MLIQVGSDRVLSALVVGDSAHSEVGMAWVKEDIASVRGELHCKRRTPGATPPHKISHPGSQNYSRSGKGERQVTEKAVLSRARAPRSASHGGYLRCINCNYT